MSAPCDRADWAGSAVSVGVCSIYGISIRVKPPGCNSLEAQEQAAYVLPPTPNATGCTVRKHCLRLGTVLWDTNSLLHSHALSLHHFRTEVNQNPASEGETGIKEFTSLSQVEMSLFRGLKAWIRSAVQDQDLPLCELELILSYIAKVIIISWTVRLLNLYGWNKHVRLKYKCVLLPGL